MQVIGMDIGGTEIKSAIVNEQGLMTDKVIVSTPIQGGSDAILQTLQSIIRKYQLQYPHIKKVGIGSAGRIDHQSGHVLYATNNLPGWTGINIKDEIESQTQLEVFVENDVNVAALGEDWLGAAQKVDHFVLLTIGTGVGAAFIHQGKIVNGPNGSVGEIGHMILYPGGKSCNCGQDGCLEQYISGTALNLMAKELNPEWDSYKLMKELGMEHKKAVQTMDVFIYHLAIGLINIYHFYDPELIIIGGGIGNTFLQWQDRLEQMLNSLSTRPFIIKKAKLGNNAGILGAAKFTM